MLNFMVVDSETPEPKKAQRVQVPIISGLWSQIPLRVWVLEPQSLYKYWGLGPSGRDSQNNPEDISYQACANHDQLRSSDGIYLILGTWANAPTFEQLSCLGM